MVFIKDAKREFLDQIANKVSGIEQMVVVIKFIKYFFV